MKKRLTPGERHNLEVEKRQKAEAEKAKANQPSPEPSIEERVAALEAKLAEHFKSIEENAEFAVKEFAALNDSLSKIGADLESKK